MHRCSFWSWPVTRSAPADLPLPSSRSGPAVKGGPSGPSREAAPLTAGSGGYGRMRLIRSDPRSCSWRFARPTEWHGRVLLWRCDAHAGGGSQLEQPCAGTDRPAAPSGCGSPKSLTFTGHDRVRRAAVSDGGSRGGDRQDRRVVIELIEQLETARGEILARPAGSRRGRCVRLRAPQRAKRRLKGTDACRPILSGSLYSRFFWGGDVERV
jgi:hypothetical protein